MSYILESLFKSRSTQTNGCPVEFVYNCFSPIENINEKKKDEWNVRLRMLAVGGGGGGGGGTGLLDSVLRGGGGAVDDVACDGST
ncbi:hypothetical protein BLOT_003930 [Blomia tropicalis]|nr:hypothetical protein BLOT_003930 [Blomia tropicalis]